VVTELDRVLALADEVLRFKVVVRASEGTSPLPAAIGRETAKS
jgi:hypothetical protein